MGAGDGLALNRWQTIIWNNDVIFNGITYEGPSKTAAILQKNISKYVCLDETIYVFDAKLIGVCFHVSCWQLELLEISVVKRVNIDQGLTNSKERRSRLWGIEVQSTFIPTSSYLTTYINQLPEVNYDVWLSTGEVFYNG